MPPQQYNGRLFRREHRDLKRNLDFTHCVMKSRKPCISCGKLISLSITQSPLRNEGKWSTTRILLRNHESLQERGGKEGTDTLIADHPPLLALTVMRFLPIQPGSCLSGLERSSCGTKGVRQDVREELLRRYLRSCSLCSPRQVWTEVWRVFGFLLGSYPRSLLWSALRIPLYSQWISPNGRQVGWLRIMCLCGWRQVFACQPY